MAGLLQVFMPQKIGQSRKKNCKKKLQLGKLSIIAFPLALPYRPGETEGKTNPNAEHSTYRLCHRKGK